MHKNAIPISIETKLKEVIKFPSSQNTVNIAVTNDTIKKTNDSANFSTTRMSFDRKCVECELQNICPAKAAEVKDNEASTANGIICTSEKISRMVIKPVIKIILFELSYVKAAKDLKSTYLEAELKL